MSAEMTYVLQDVRKGRALTPLPACILRRPHCTLPSSGSRGRKLILSCSRLQFSFPMCCFHLPFGSSFLPVLFCLTQYGAHFSCSLSLSPSLPHLLNLTWDIWVCGRVHCSLILHPFFLYLLAPQLKLMDLQSVGGGDVGVCLVSVKLPKS